MITYPFRFLDLPKEPITTHWNALFNFHSYLVIRSLPVTILRTCKIIHQEALPMLKPKMYKMLTMPPAMVWEHLQGSILFDDWFSSVLRLIDISQEDVTSVTTFGGDVVAKAIDKDHFLRLCAEKHENYAAVTSPSQRGFLVQNMIARPASFHSQGLVCFVRKASLYMETASSWPAWFKQAPSLSSLTPQPRNKVLRILLHGIDDRNIRSVERWLITTLEEASILGGIFDVDIEFVFSRHLSGGSLHQLMRRKLRYRFAISEFCRICPSFPNARFSGMATHEDWQNEWIESEII